MTRPDTGVRDALRVVTTELHASLHSRAVPYSECDWPECLTVRAALAATPSAQPEGLDVERLATALWHASPDDDAERYAVAVAAEYAALLRDTEGGRNG